MKDRKLHGRSIGLWKCLKCGFSLAMLKCLMLFSVYSADVITFNPSTAVGVTNYLLNYGPTNRTTTNRIAMGTNTLWTITNLAPATVSFVFVTAQANGIESNPSNEILYTNRNFAPNTLKLSGTDALMLQSSIDNRTWKTLAIITSTNTPLLVSMAPRQSFRTITTNLPPLPR